MPAGWTCSCRVTASGRCRGRGVCSATPGATPDEPDPKPHENTARACVSTARATARLKGSKGVTLITSPFALLSPRAEDAPTDAIKWAKRIENEAERETVLIQVARVWRYLDEAAAERWLLQSSLSPEAREQVRAPVEEKEPPPPNG